jgi:hypothetical protein
MQSQRREALQTPGRKLLAEELLVYIGPIGPVVRLVQGPLWEASWMLAVMCV